MKLSLEFTKLAELFKEAQPAPTAPPKPAAVPQAQPRPAKPAGPLNPGVIDKRPDDPLAPANAPRALRPAPPAPSFSAQSLYDRYVTPAIQATGQGLNQGLNNLVYTQQQPHRGRIGTIPGPQSWPAGDAIANNWSLPLSLAYGVGQASLLGQNQAAALPSAHVPRPEALRMAATTAMSTMPWQGTRSPWDARGQWAFQEHLRGLIQAQKQDARNRLLEAPVPGQPILPGLHYAS